MDGLGLNTFQPTAGPALSIHYDTKSVEGSDGLRTTKRWESDDGWHTLRGPLEDGTLALPPDQFKTEEKQWFHGNTLELPDGRLLAALQGTHQPWVFRTFWPNLPTGGKPGVF